MSTIFLNVLFPVISKRRSPMKSGWKRLSKPGPRWLHLTNSARCKPAHSGSALLSMNCLEFLAPRYAHIIFLSFSPTFFYLTQRQSFVDTATSFFHSETAELKSDWPARLLQMSTMICGWLADCWREGMSLFRLASTGGALVTATAFHLLTCIWTWLLREIKGILKWRLSHYLYYVSYIYLCVITFSYINTSAENRNIRKLSHLLLTL